jgi:hypothetical protein
VRPFWSDTSCAEPNVINTVHEFIADNIFMRAVCRNDTDNGCPTEPASGKSPEES